MKGSFKDSCWLPHCLGDEMLLSLLPRKHRWEGFLATSTLVNRGLFPELHALLFQMEKFSLHNHYQQISHKVFRHLSLTLTPYDEARSRLPKGKYHVVFSSHSQEQFQREPVFNFLLWFPFGHAEEPLKDVSLGVLDAKEKDLPAQPWRDSDTSHGLNPSRISAPSS